MPNFTPSQIEAIKAYTGSSYFAINSYLRKGGAFRAEVGTYIADLDAALEANPAPASVTVYRGVSEAYASQLAQDGVKAGEIITDKAFLSTSRLKNVAEGFLAGTGGLLFEIRVDPGALAADVAEYSTFPHEAETLVARDARFRVLGYDSDEDVLQLEYVR